MNAVRNKVAVITGAGSGIGRAIAIELAARGARLALSDVNERGLVETVESIERIGGKAHHARLDVADREAFQVYAAQVVAHYGTVHQVYNNAGIAGSKPLAKSSYEDIERVLAVNLWGVIHGTKEFLPHLIASGDGDLVNVSSLNGFMGQAALSAYCASKFAVRGFSESVRVEMLLARHPVRVTLVHPAGVKTNIANAVVKEAGPLSEKDAQRAAIYNDKLFKTTAAAAGKTIVDGVVAGKPRILIGSDATVVDRLVRLLPSTYPRLTAAWQRRVFGE